MRRKSQEEFANQVLSARGDSIELLSPYINAKTQVRVRCRTCGSEYDANPRQLVSGTGKGCKRCRHIAAGKVNGLIGGKWKKYNIDTARKIIESDGEYKLLSNTYKTVKDKLHVLHLKCNNEFDVTLDHFKFGTRCPYCCRNPVRNTEIVKKVVHDLSDGEYTLVSEYKTAKEKVKLYHAICNQIIEVSPDTFSRNPYCPFCGSSKGEQKIERYLTLHNIQHSREYSFPDFKSKNDKPFRFDFAIFINNKVLLVEYDGEFHFEKFYEDQNFEKQKEYDAMKNVYAYEHGIPLLRIPYTKIDDIENELEVFIKKNA